MTNLLSCLFLARMHDETVGRRGAGDCLVSFFTPLIEPGHTNWL